MRNSKLSQRPWPGEIWERWRPLGIPTDKIVIKKVVGFDILFLGMDGQDYEPINYTLFANFWKKIA